MAYPAELLSEGEEIILEFKPHWSALWQEALATIAYIVVLILLIDGGINFWVFLIVTALWAWLGLRGYLTWATTEHVITNERFVFRTGALRKAGYEIPLEAINDVAFRQNVLERTVGVGDVLMETAGTRGQSRLNNIPNPEEIKRIIGDARKHRSHDVAVGGGTAQAAAPTASNAEQLAILGDLLDQGKISQEEYDAEKRRLLG